MRKTQDVLGVNMIITIILAYLLVNTWLSLIISTQSGIIEFDDLPLMLLMTVFNPFVCLAICWIINKIKKMITKAHSVNSQFVE